MTTSDGIRERLTNLVQSLSPENRQDTAVETFMLLGEEGIFDSMTAFRLVVAIEKEFGVVVTDGEISPERFRNIESLERFIREKINANGT